MEKRCYICKKTITEENRSKEHLIPNSVGGKLVSYDIWCKECTEYYGNLDVVIANAMKPVVSLLDIWRDRGKHQNFKAEDPEGIELIVQPGGSTSIRKPSILVENEGERKRIHICAVGKSHNERVKNLKQILKGLQRKYPQISDEKIEEQLQVVRSQKAYPDDMKMKVSASFGGEEGFRAFSKIALHSYIHYFGWPSNLAEIANYIKDGKSNYTRAWFSYTYKPFIETEEITNSIYICGIKQENILYAFIELSSVYPILVCLDKEYAGDDIEQIYSHNVIKNIEGSPLVVRKLRRPELLDILQKKERNYDHFKLQFEKLLKHYYRANNL